MGALSLARNGYASGRGHSQLRRSRDASRNDEHDCVSPVVADGGHLSGLMSFRVLRQRSE